MVFIKIFNTQVKRMFYLIILLLFDEVFTNEITLKMKGPGLQYLFCKNDSNGYSYKGSYPSKIILNKVEYTKSISNNLIELENELNIIKLKWDNILSDLSYMFYGCENILEVDLTDMDSSQVSNLKYMFSNCNHLSSVKLFNQNINQGHNNFYLNYMFSQCSSLVSVNSFNISLNQYYQNIYMSYMFYGCSSLISGIIPNIESFGYYAKVYMDFMFYNCSSLISLVNHNITIIGYYSHIYMDYMFKECSCLIISVFPSINIKGYYGKIYTYYMFDNCEKLTFANLSNIYAYGYYAQINFTYLFNNCSSLMLVYFDNMRLSSFGTNGMTNFMFHGCKNIKYINFKNFGNNNNFNFTSIFDDVPENIVYCVDKSSQLYNLLSQKKNSVFDCNDNLLKNLTEIIFRTNISIDNYSENLLYKNINISYDVCPKGTYESNFECLACYYSCDSCEQSGTDNNNNCISCKSDYKFIEVQKNYLKNCYKYYYNKEGDNIYINECPKGFEPINFFSFCTDNNITQINKLYLEIQCTSEFPFEIVNTKKCTNFCNLIEIENNFCIYNYKNETTIKKEKMLNVIKFNFQSEDFKLYIDQFSDIIINENELKFKITTIKRKDIDFSNNKIIFNECEENLFNKYNISQYSILILLITETYLKEINSIKYEYEIYFPLDGKILQFLCKLEIIEGKKCDIKDRLYKKCIPIPDPKKKETSLSELLEFQNELLNNLKKEITSAAFNITIVQDNDIMIEEEGTTFILTTSENQKNNMEGKNNLITLNIGECEIELRKEYNINNNSCLYILRIDKYLQGMKIPKIEYEIYAFLNNSKLQQLDLSICKNKKLEIYIPINISMDQYNKYDIKSGYYNDICYTDSFNGIDMTLNDRKNKFIENNMTLCEENCDFQKYDNKIGKAICSCLTKIKMPLISEISFDKNKLKEKFMDFKNIANIKILKCYYLLFNKKSLLKNIGFLSISPLLILYLISIFIFCCKESKKIKKKINDIINAKINKTKSGKNKLNQNIKNTQTKKRNLFERKNKSKHKKIKLNSINNNPPLKKRQKIN